MCINTHTLSSISSNQTKSRMVYVGWDGNKGTCDPVSYCLTDVCLIVFGKQWSSMAHGNEIDQAMDVNTMLVGSLVWVCTWCGSAHGIVDNKTNVEYFQSYPLKECMVSFATGVKHAQ